MANWYDPNIVDRSIGVGQIKTDLTASMVTDTDGNTTLDVPAFMALAATRIAAIPEPTPPFHYNTPELLRGINVRPFVDKLVADLGAVTTTNMGSVDLSSLLAALSAKSAAVTAYYTGAYSTDVADMLLENLASGPIDKAMPDAEDTTPETRYYRTTFVTDWSEESAPSLVSDAIDVGPKDTVTITVGSVPGSRNIAYWRPYRSNSGSEGAAYQYVPSTNDLGVPIATATLVDSVPNSKLQEACPTTIWDQPPATLQGLIGMANGFHLGFFGNTLCPSVANAVYAYPTDYQITVEWPIVGLAAWEQSAFVGTRGKPYFVTGADPASLTARVLDSNQACVSARSICSTEQGVVYASPDGLCLATPAGVRLLTEGHFTREEWQALNLSNLIVQEHDGVVYLFQEDLALLPAYVWAAYGLPPSGVTGQSLTDSNQTWNATLATGGYTGAVRSTTALTGKVYCEFKSTTRPGTMPVSFGIASGDGLASFLYSGTYAIFSGNGGCSVPSAGYAANSTLNSNGAYSFSQGDNIGIAVDMTSSPGKIWYRKNGTWLSGDPAAGTSPTSIFTSVGPTWYFNSSAYSCSSSGTLAHKIYPSASSQTYAAPTGFTPYQP